MHSEFYNVDLDRVRYSLVWEDSHTLYTALAPTPDDRILVITSAGCNVLNILLQSPREVVAVDLNPVQNALLRFKIHLIEHHTHGIFRALMGFDGGDAVTPALAEVAPTLPDDQRAYWTSFFKSHPDGILPAGKLESYILGFFQTLPPTQQQALERLVQADEVLEQQAIFTRELSPTDFRERFINYFDEANLSKGRDPRLFKYAQESGGEAFYNRFIWHVETALLKNNFFTRFFFLGPQHLPESVLPPCYQADNFARLKANLNRLTIVDGEAVDYLLSDAGRGITKASLSNIFEYASPDEFARVCRLLGKQSGHLKRVLFWNLLQEQTAPPDSGWQETVLTNRIDPDRACFYFRDVRLLNQVAS
ncbi:MAG: DUF3419 family protein [Cytophagales bacterium]|nr:MAG: DUF3419 family protein [Cytophagales bacterium]